MKERPNRLQIKRAKEAYESAQIQKAITSCEQRKDNPIFLKFRYDAILGYAVYTTEDIQEGQFLLEYPGCLISKREGKKRESQYEDQKKGCFLFFFTDKKTGASVCLDATEEERLGKFVNDSPAEFVNAKMKQIAVGSRPALCLFATKFLVKSTEIRYDYSASNLSWRRDYKEYTEPTYLDLCQFKDTIKDLFSRNGNLLGKVVSDENVNASPDIRTEKNESTESFCNQISDKEIDEKVDDNPKATSVKIVGNVDNESLYVFLNKAKYDSCMEEVKPLLEEVLNKVVNQCQLSNTSTSKIESASSKLSLEMFEIKNLPNSFSNSIGEGSAATVYCYELDSKKVAIKKFRNRLLRGGRTFKICETLLKINSPNIVKFLGYSFQPSCFIFEHCELYWDGDVVNNVQQLMEILNNQNEFNFLSRLDIVLQASLGLKVLHQQNIVHKDFKPSNLLINGLKSNFVVKVCDFDGLYYLKTKTKTTMTNNSAIAGCTISYCANEIVLRQLKSPGIESDIFSWAMTAFEIMAGEDSPWATTLLAVSDELIIKALEKNERPSLDLLSERYGDNEREFLQNIISQAWQSNWLQRPNIHEIISLLYQNLNLNSVTTSIDTDDVASEDLKTIMDDDVDFSQIINSDSSSKTDTIQMNYLKEDLIIVESDNDEEMETLLSSVYKFVKSDCSNSDEDELDTGTQDSILQCETSIKNVMLDEVSPLRTPVDGIAEDLDEFQENIEQNPILNDSGLYLDRSLCVSDTDASDENLSEHPEVEENGDLELLNPDVQEILFQRAHSNFNVNNYNDVSGNNQEDVISENDKTVKTAKIADSNHLVGNDDVANVSGAILGDAVIKTDVKENTTKKAGNNCHVNNDFTSLPDNYPQDVVGKIDNRRSTSKKRTARQDRLCIYCGKYFAGSKLRRHLVNLVKEEKEVKDAIDIDKEKKKEKDAAFRVLINRGILKHNMNEASKDEPNYQASRKGKPEEPLSRCSHCSKVLQNKNFSKHKKTCADSRKLHLKNIENIPMEVSNLSVNVSGEFEKYILRRFHNDKVSKQIKNDPMLLKLGNVFYTRVRRKQDKRVSTRKSVRSDLRMLSRIYMILKETNEFIQEQGNIMDMFFIHNFPSLRNAIDQFTSYEDGSLKAGLKQNLYYLMKRAARTLQALMIEERNRKVGEEIKDFIEVFEMWDDLIFGDAVYENNNRRQIYLRHPEQLPNEEDVKMVREHILTRIQCLTNDFTFLTKSEFVELRDIAYARLLIINGRRDSEPTRIMVKDWLYSRADGWIPEDMQNQLDDFDKLLIKKMKVAYVSGKGINHQVPVIFPPDTYKALDILSVKKVRDDCGVNPDNN